VPEVNRVVPHDNILIFYDIFEFHRPAESKKKRLINEVE